MTDADAMLEAEIDTCMRIGLHAEDRAVAREAFATMARLIDHRSLERVREMEREKGLR